MFDGSFIFLALSFVVGHGLAEKPNGGTKLCCFLSTVRVSLFQIIRSGSFLTGDSLPFLN